MVFNARHSQMMKGLAILLMVYHHLFGCIEWQVEGINYLTIPFGNTSVEYCLGVFGKLCIAIYAFLSGYGLYISYNKRMPSWKNYLTRILKILVNWWMILLLFFVPILLLCGHKFHVPEVLKNVFLFDISWCPFADYLQFYICLLITFPLINTCIQKMRQPVAILILSPIVSIGIRKGINLLIPSGFCYNIIYFYMLYLPYVLAGCCVCQGNLFQKVNLYLEKRKLDKWWIFVLLALCIIPIRLLITGNRMPYDSYLAVIFVFGVAGLFQSRNMPKMEALLMFLGKHSTNIWFEHAIFFFSVAGIIQKIVYFPFIPFLILAWCIIMCMPTSCIINWGMKRIFHS